MLIIQSGIPLWLFVEIYVVDQLQVGVFQSNCISMA